MMFQHRLRRRSQGLIEEVLTIDSRSRSDLKPRSSCILCFRKYDSFAFTILLNRWAEDRGTNIPLSIC